MKKRILKKANALLAAILALFGVAASCDDGNEIPDLPCAYGTPTAEYIEITGTVQNEAQNPIENIQVVMDWDTTYTGADGSFVLRREGDFPVRTVTLQFNDTDEASHGRYQNDSAEVQITYTGGDGSWDAGIGHGSVTKTLKEKTE
ncbi:MAG: radical SAM-associated putative lipoprotein [Bacteroidales bacterium]|nr:radical SAM-associated putative lipoprotein [Bacteroidales bacterium]